MKWKWKKVEPTAGRTIDDWKKRFTKYPNAFSGTALVDKALFSRNLPNDFYLPEGLTSIGESALGEAFVQGEKFDLPASLSSIGKSAFENALFDIAVDWHIPGSVKVLPERVFARVSYKGNLTFNEGLEKISAEAFVDSYFDVKTPFDLPDSLVKIEPRAFAGMVYSFRGVDYDVPQSTDIAFLRAWFLNPHQPKN